MATVCSVSFAGRAVLSDGNHLLVRRHSYQLFLSGRSATIPCRPTRPDATVTLTKMASYDEPVTLGDNVAFDRHSGFLVRRANRYFDGSFKCIASVDGLTSQQRVIAIFKGKTVDNIRPF